MTLRKIFGIGLALLLALGAACAQNSAGTELQGKLRGLGTTLRMLEITAHPGDEDGALLLYFSHEMGAEVTLLTLTRGERGDSRLGIMEPTEQGLLRTMEQLASDTHYGAEQRFTRVVDFGFAHTANEVFDRWLTEALVDPDLARRWDSLAHWSDAPAARDAHPREEHLLPLMIAAGAAADSAGTRIFSDTVMRGARISGYRFG